MALYETLKYQVVKHSNNMEIRQYDQFMLASTKTGKDKTMSSGFNNVFNYISGNNKKHEKISMTTPVVSYEEDDALVTGFYVPSKYVETNVPQPATKQVFIQSMEPSLYAVIRFGGRWQEERFKRQEEALRQFIDEEGYEIISKRLLFRYQPPFVPAFFRRNELAFRIRKRPHE